jgi:hypothetical protein
MLSKPEKVEAFVLVTERLVIVVVPNHAVVAVNSVDVALVKVLSAVKMFEEYILGIVVEE